MTDQRELSWEKARRMAVQPRNTTMVAARGSNSLQTVRLGNLRTSWILGTIVRLKFLRELDLEIPYHFV
jgi:hypothetical protein